MNPNTKIIGPDRPDTCTPTRTGDIIQGGPWDGFEVIDTYSRAQAIADGVLVDLTDTARKYGFRYPVACTEGVWSGAIAGNNEDETETRTNIRALLLKLYDAIRAGNGGDELHFRAVNRRNPSAPINLWAKCHPGDNAEPVLTIMLEGED